MSPAANNKKKKHPQVFTWNSATKRWDDSQAQKYIYREKLRQGTMHNASFNYATQNAVKTPIQPKETIPYSRYVKFLFTTSYLYI